MKVKNKEKTPKLNRKVRAKLSLSQKIKNVVELYDDLIFSKLVGNTSKYCRKIPQENNKIGIDFLGSYDGDNLTFYYTIDKLPKELFIDWKDRLRSECKGGVRITFIDNIRRHKIEWESPQMQSRLRILRQVSEDTDEKDIDAYNIHKSINLH